MEPWSLTLGKHGGGLVVLRDLNTGIRRQRVSVVKCCFTSTETLGLIGTGAQDGHLDFHTAPGLCRQFLDPVGTKPKSCVKVEVAVLSSSLLLYVHGSEVAY